MFELLFQQAPNPWSLATGDFNRDGKLDIAVCNDGTGVGMPDSVSVLLGDGQGRFGQSSGSPVPLPPNTGPLSIAAADMNADGKPDLVTANFHGQSVGVLLGNGDGTFAPTAGSPFSVPTVQPWSIAVADFNVDGKLDVVIGTWEQGIAVLSGDGTGRLTLAAGNPVAAGTWPHNVAVGDFNNDGKPDVAVGNHTVQFTWPDYGNVTVLLGNGDSTFRVSPNGQLPAGRWVDSVRTADFNGDGQLDILAVGWGYSTATVLLGDGTGIVRPSPGPPSAVGGFSRKGAVGDFDRDGTPDVVTSAGYVLLNRTRSPSLRVAQERVGLFVRGQSATYKLTLAHQAGSGPTREAVTLTEALPPRFLLESMAGDGWACMNTTCTRSDLLAGGGAYPPLTVRVIVPPDAPAEFLHTVNIATSGASPLAESLSIGVEKTPQTISRFEALASRTYGVAPFAVLAVASSLLPVEFVSITPDTCTVSGVTATVIGAGTCSITAVQPGNAIFGIAPAVTQSFVIERTPLRITADSKTITYGSSLAFTASFDGFVRSDTASVLSGNATFRTNATFTNGKPDAGSWTITPELGTLSARNYNLTFLPGALTVNKATLTVAATNVSKVFGAPVPNLITTTSGWVNGDTAVVIAGAPAVSTSATASSAVGIYPIEVSQGTLASANYGFLLVNGTVTVNKAETAVSVDVGNTKGTTVGVVVRAVPPGAGTPTGTVALSTGGAIPAALLGGSATLGVGPGTHSVEYSGDSNFKLSRSSAFSIYDPRTSMDLRSSASPSTLGQAVTFTASVQGDGGPSNGGPTGEVQFWSGTKLLGSAVVTNGRAILTTAGLPGGEHFIQARYSGDGFWPPTSASASQFVSAVVNLSFLASPDAPTFAEAITLKVSLSGTVVPPGFGPPSGQVTFFLPAPNPFSAPISLGSAVVTAGTAVLTINTLTAGTHTLIARYEGDGTWNAVSRDLKLTVAPAATRTVVSMAPTSRDLTLTASVVPLSGTAVTPTGTVRFLDTSTDRTIATAEVSAGLASAQIETSSAASVTGRPIAAVYSGDASFRSSTSPALPALVNAASMLVGNVAPDGIASIFGITGLPVQQGSSVTALDGVTVRIADTAGAERMARLYAVVASAGLISFVAPAGLAPGTAAVSIGLPDGRSIQTAVTVAPAAPGLFTANMNGTGAFIGQHIYVREDASQQIAEAVMDDGTGRGFIPRPILMQAAREVYLVLYGTGIRHARSLSADMNGDAVPVQFFGAQGDQPGLDQINLGPVPANLAGRGIVKLTLTVDQQPANAVTAHVQ